MPLRIDLLADPTFRQDIMDLITRLIREKGDEIIRETVMSAGWLEDRVAAYLCKHPLDGLVWTKLMEAIQAAPSPVIKAVKDAVMPGLHEALRLMFDDKFRKFEADAQRWVERQVDQSVRLVLSGLVKDTATGKR